MLSILRTPSLSSCAKWGSFGFSFGGMWWNDLLFFAGGGNMNFDLETLGGNGMRRSLSWTEERVDIFKDFRGSSWHPTAMWVLDRLDYKFYAHLGHGSVGVSQGLVINYLPVVQVWGESENALGTALPFLFWMTLNVSNDPLHVHKRPDRVNFETNWTEDLVRASVFLKMSNIWWGTYANRNPCNWGNLRTT